MDNNEYKPIELNEEIYINKLYSVHYFTYSRKFQFAGEKHNFFEFVYCDSGEASVVDNDNHYVLKEGMAILHAPNVFHLVKPNDKLTNVVIVSFDGHLDKLKHYTGATFYLNNQEKSLLKTIISEGRNALKDPLNIVYQYELQAAPNFPIGAFQIIKNSLESLMLMISRSFDQKLDLKIDNASKSYQELCNNIIQVLELNINEKVSLKKLAEQLKYSETHIKNVFKLSTGTTIINYFNNLKIDKAKQLLSETTYTISQISEILGFDSIQYFSRLFKKITNMTPSAYQTSITSGVL